MDDIVNQSVLGNALQRISELERIAQPQLNTDPPPAEAANQTNATNAVEELYQRFPSLRRQSSIVSAIGCINKHITSIPFVYMKNIEQHNIYNATYKCYDTSYK